MDFKNKRKLIIVGICALLLTAMQITGWQISMLYNTSVHTSDFFQKIGVLSTTGCILVGIIEWILWAIALFFLFSKRENTEAMEEKKGLLWLYLGLGIFAVYVLALIGCYPGFYNYDVGNQIPQVLYADVPYDAHHPLVHTLLMGGIMKLGYYLNGMRDLTLGVFLYNLTQMSVCVAAFTYSLRFIYRRTKGILITVLATCFYVLCPPILMFAMSTTKDILCYAFLVFAVLKLISLYEEIERNQKIKIQDWLFAGFFLMLACVLRNNIVYAVIVFIPFVLLITRKNVKKQALFYVAVVLLSYVINNSLIAALHAEKGTITEALSVPLQQLARLYQDKGEEAFEGQDAVMLYASIEPEMLRQYDPFISDSIKFAFWRHLDVIMDHKKEFIGMWVRGGLHYPGVYIRSFLDNTYQTWYPGTILRDKIQNRYFMVTGWQDDYAAPKMPWLYDFYIGMSENSYAKVPLLRLFCSTGTMIWMLFITWFFAVWKRDRRLIVSLLLLIVITGSALCGPVSDLRYYLYLFFLFPVFVSFYFEKHTKGKRQEAKVLQEINKEQEKPEKDKVQTAGEVSVATVDDN